MYEKTRENLMKSFAGESMARNKYTFFASKAKKEGYEQIAAFFLETAENEKEHAKRMFRFLKELEGDTAANLKTALDGEHQEWTELYNSFAATAREEGWAEVADFYEELGKVDKAHEERYQALLDNIKNDTVFKKDQAVVWKCRNCGYLHEGEEALDRCPVCNHPLAYQEVHCLGY